MKLPAGFEMGTVKFFGLRKDVFGGLYGFLALPDGDEIFFHGDAMGTFIGMELVENSACFNEPSRYPKTGDKIVFHTIYDRWKPWKRPKADPWAFADDLEKAMEEMESRRLAAI